MAVWEGNAAEASANRSAPLQGHESDGTGVQGQRGFGEGAGQTSLNV